MTPDEMLERYRAREKDREARKKASEDRSQVGDLTGKDQKPTVICFTCRERLEECRCVPEEPELI